MRATAQIIDDHRSRGRRFEVGGIGSFARDEGSGTPILMLHGVPVSSFVYRKLVPLLAEDFRAVAIDFPGLGLADRPEDFDYSWSGLARFTEGALDALEIERCHLIVHDIGGPIGCEVAIRNPDRIASLTVLDTLFDWVNLRRPWTMRPLAHRGLGEAWLRSTIKPLFAELMYVQGIKDRSATSRDELYAHYDLLKQPDGGRAFLKIMRGFELTEEKQRFIWDGLRDRPYPAQIVWGAEDPALGEDWRRAAEQALGIDDPLLLPAKHFLQEDQAPSLATIIATFAGKAQLGPDRPEDPGAVLEPGEGEQASSL